MESRLSLDDMTLKRLSQFTEELTELFHKFTDVCPDFDNNNFDVTIAGTGEVIGTVEITENAEFEFFPRT